VQDITERKAVEGALREQRGLYKSITDNASLALFIMDDRQQCVFMNPAAEQLTGFCMEELKGRPLHDYIHHTHPDGTPYPLEECPIDQVMPKNDRETGEEVFIHKDGHFYDVRFTASPIRDHQGMSTGTVIEVEDITERKRSDRQIMLLMREVNHRSKNMLAVVQAIAAQTALHTDPAEFVRSFSNRLQSLAASHDLLVNNSWQGVGISELVSSQLQHLEASKKQITTQGPELRLSPSASQALGLALHELGTNAIKYGSLSENGEVLITWEVRPDGQFEVCWRETGGPLVAPPRKNGFGTRLIKQMTQMALEGNVTVQYDPTGLIWKLSAPLQKVIQSEQ
jgi:PAS domain S-box-containing protein